MSRRTEILSSAAVVSAIGLLLLPGDAEQIRLRGLFGCLVVGVSVSIWSGSRVSRQLRPALRSIAVVLSKVLKRGNTSRRLLAESGVLGRKEPIDAVLDAARKVLSGPDELLDSVRENVTEIVRLYELLTTNIAASVVIFDDKRRVTFCSAFTEYLTGYNTDEILISEEDILKQIVIEEDRERYLRAWNVSRLGEDIHVRYQITHRSGLRLWLESRFVPLTNSDGEVVSVLSVTMDLTDTLAYQRQIEEKNRDLQDFAYMISHDLKAPIFTIKGMANALEEDYRDALGSDGKELLQYIIEGAERLERLVHSVLQYSRISTQSGKELDVELSGLLTQVLHDYTQQVKDAGATIEIPEELPFIRADPLRLYQVFSNLIGNAIKYRSDKRPLVVTLSTRKLSAERVVIEVADNGDGIPIGKIDDIFRPFHRAHGSEIEGSGIGLACVKKVVEGYGGTVAVKSQEGVGSVFIVTLPTPPPRPQSIPDELQRAYE